MKENNTIVGISTAIGGGISIIRISGSKSIDIIKKMFKSKKDEELNLNLIEDKKLKLGYIYNLEGEKIDEVMISIMRNPNSYTVEDVVEINCHGGVVVTNYIQKEIIRNGARLAEPGEFTKRAFLNGRIDLSEAKSVMDIINAKTEEALKYGIAHLNKNLKKEIDIIREKVLRIIAQIEVTVDYPEDDIEEYTTDMTKLAISEIEKEIEKVHKDGIKGEILREGLSIIIVGKPNVGKSSLLNRIMNEEKAIVTNIAGTTRDLISEHININGIPVKIVDTAGIREAEDPIEKIGIEKTITEIEKSDLILYVHDSNVDFDGEEIDFIEKYKNKNMIIILNKIDLNSIQKDIKLNFNNIIKMSTIKNEGIDEVKNKISELVNNGTVKVNSNQSYNNMKNEEVYMNIYKKIEEIKKMIQEVDNIDMVTIDLRDIYEMLTEIIGETLNDDIVNKIFSEFCVGK